MSDPYSDAMELIEPGESLRWAGRPRPLAMAWQLGRIQVLMGAFFLVFMYFWLGFFVDWGDIPGTIEIIKAEQTLVLFGIVGVLFVGQGINMLFRPVWYLLAASRYLYAITDRRVLIARNLLGTRQISHSIESLGSVDKREALGGGWSYLFPAMKPPGGWQRLGPSLNYNVTVHSYKSGLFGVDDGLERHLIF